MIQFNKNSFRNSKHVLYWYGLAFQAGAINAGGFLACHSFVSHVTGFGTMIGIQVASGQVLQALELLAIPFYFLAGASLSALLIDKRQALGKPAAYVTVAGLIFFCILSVFFAGNLGWLGDFGEPFELYQDILLVSPLCIACGLQNASGVSATQGMIRTTHLTGILTDYGVNLVRNRYLKRFSKEKYRQVVINKVRLGTFIAFSTGSTISAVVFLKFQYKGFLLPCVTSFVFFGVSYMVSLRQESSVKHLTKRLLQAKPKFEKIT